MKQDVAMALGFVWTKDIFRSKSRNLLAYRNWMCRHLKWHYSKYIRISSGSNPSAERNFQTDRLDISTLLKIRIVQISKTLFSILWIDKLGYLLFIITQDIPVSYIPICNILYIFPIRHFKLTRFTFYKAEIIRKLGRLLTIGTHNLHDITI